MNRPEPSNLEAHLGYWLRCLSNFVSQTFAERLEKEGVSVAQWVVLRTLYNHRGVTLNEAAQHIGVDKSSLSRMVERLLQKGWLNRTDGSDRRSLELTLTPAGRALVPRLAKLADENDETFFRPLSARQRKEFLGTIRHLLATNGWNAADRGQDRMH